MNSKTGFFWVSIILVAVLYVMSMSMPFFENSPVNQPTGYSSLCYPVRILISRLLDGTTGWAATLLPAAATFLSV